MKSEFSSAPMKGFLNKGRSAARAGLPRKCPYEPRPFQEKQRRAWLTGWDQEHAKMQAAAKTATAVAPA